MTSIPLTLRKTSLSRNEGPLPSSLIPTGGGPGQGPARGALTGARCSVLTSALAVGRRARELLLDRVLVGGGLDHRLEDLLVGLVPVGTDAPLGAVPGLDACPGRSHVVDARGADRADHAGEAQRVELLLVEREVLQAPAHLFGRHHLAFAEAFLRALDRLDAEHLDHHAAHVEHRTDLVLRPRALALVVDVLQDVPDDLEVLARSVQRERVVALGAGADVLHVGFGARPPHAVHLVARVAGGLRFLQRGRVHHPPAPQQHVVGAALAHLQPGRLLLDAGRRHRDQLQLEAVHLRAFLQQRDRLLAERAVVVDERDLLALELVEAAFLLGDVLDQDVGGGPVAAEDGGVPLEDAAVLARRQAVADGEQRHLVGRRLVGEREGDAGRLRIEQRVGLALQALVALDALVGGVAGLALLVGDLHAVDAAVAGDDHLQVVLLAVGPRRAVGRVGAGAVDQQREELLLGLRLGRGRRDDGRGCGEGEDAQFHVCLRGCDEHVRRAVRRFNAGTATAAASPWRSPTAAPGRGARRPGRTRSARRR